MMSQSPQVRSDRRAVAVAVAVAAAIAVWIVVAAAAPARANLTLIRCTGMWDLRYTPGLTYTPQTVTIFQQKELTTCLAPLTDPYLAAGAIPDLTTELPDRSCLELAINGDFTELIHWKSAHGHYRGTSAIGYHSESRYVNGQLIVAQTGRVIAGRFTGATIIGEETAFADLLGCLTSEGVTHLQGPSTLVVAGLPLP
jgi:hypothetical protein